MPGYNHPTYEHILRLIREAIREGSLTQSQVAERLEITQAGVSKLLSGDSCLNTIAHSLRFFKLERLRHSETS